MDEMKLTLTTKFMRGIAAKLISRALYKKFGYKIDIQLNDLDIRMIDGETTISANIEGKLGSNEFKKLMKDVDLI